MARVKRKDFQSFIDANPLAGPEYEVLGADLEELLIEMNKEVSTVNNILGESSIRITNGNKQASVEPYYADTSSSLFDFLQTAIDLDQELDDLKTSVVEVKLYEAVDTGLTDNYPAFKEVVYVEPTSYGGDTEGYGIPFNVHFTGERTEGGFDPATKLFTAGTWDAGAFTPA